MFWQTMQMAAEQVLILYLVVAVGVVADKTGLFTRKAALLCTNLLFYVITPCKIVESFLSIPVTPETTKGLAVAAGCGVLLHLAGVLASTLLFRKSPMERASIFRYAAVYGNVGYMALPLANAVIGAQGVFYCSAVILVFQVFAFSHGVYLMSRSPEDTRGKMEWKKIIWNPGTIAVLLSLPLFVFQVQLPSLLSQPVAYIASMNTPLAMLILGTYIANTRMRELWKEWRIAVVALIKLIILPLAMLGIFRLLGISGTLLTAMMISASAPSANNLVMFAAKYDKDTGLCAQAITAVSLLSIVTMPAMIALASM